MDADDEDWSDTDTVVDEMPHSKMPKSKNPRPRRLQIETLPLNGINGIRIPVVESGDEDVPDTSLIDIKKAKGKLENTAERIMEIERRLSASSDERVRTQAKKDLNAVEKRIGRTIDDVHTLAISAKSIAALLILAKLFLTYSQVHYHYLVFRKPNIQEGDTKHFNIAYNNCVAICDKYRSKDDFLVVLAEAYRMNALYYKDVADSTHNALNAMSVAIETCPKTKTQEGDIKYEYMELRMVLVWERGMYRRKLEQSNSPDHWQLNWHKFWPDMYEALDLRERLNTVKEKQKKHELVRHIRLSELWNLGIDLIEYLKEHAWLDTLTLWLHLLKLILLGKKANAEDSSVPESVSVITCNLGNILDDYAENEKELGWSRALYQISVGVAMRYDFPTRVEKLAMAASNYQLSLESGLLPKLNDAITTLEGGSSVGVMPVLESLIAAPVINLDGDIIKDQSGELLAYVLKIVTSFMTGKSNSQAKRDGIGGDSGDGREKKRSREEREEKKAKKKKRRKGEEKREEKSREVEMEEEKMEEGKMGMEKIHKTG